MELEKRIVFGVRVGGMVRWFLSDYIVRFDPPSPLSKGGRREERAIR
jgi:hypothetical protein